MSKQKTYSIKDYLLLFCQLFLAFVALYTLGLLLSYCSYVPRYVNWSTLPVDVLWRAELEELVTQPPLLTDDLALITTPSSLYALDIRTGEIRWHYSVQNHSGPLALVVAHDIVIVGQGDHLIVAIALADGKLRWQKRLWEDPYYYTRGIVVKNDFVVVLGQPTVIIALSLDDGTRQWKMDSWKYEIRDRGVDIHLLRGQIYITDIDRTYLVDPRSGKIKVAFDLDLGLMQLEDEYLFDRYSVYRGETFAFMFDLDVPCRMDLPYTFEKEMLYGAANCGGIYALSLQTGRAKWKYSFDSRVSPPLALYRDHLYALFENGEVHAISIDDGAKHGVLATNAPLALGASGLLTSRGITTNGEVMVVTFNDMVVLGLGKK